MSFAALYKKSILPSMTPAERRDAVVLIIENELGSRNHIRHSLTGSGFPNVIDAGDLALGLEKMQTRKVTHVVFDAGKSALPPKDFLIKALEIEPNLVAIPSSFEPTVDDVFGLLVVGARGYLVKPVTQEGIDNAVVMATKGDPLSDSILYAKDRNEALASLILTALDKLAVVMRQAQQFETAKKEQPKRVIGLRRACEIGNVFADGGLDELLEALIEACIERAEGPASRLGRMRKRLDAKKNKILAGSGSSKEAPNEGS